MWTVLSNLGIELNEELALSAKEKRGALTNRDKSDAPMTTETKVEKQPKGEGDHETRISLSTLFSQLFVYQCHAYAAILIGVNDVSSRLTDRS